MSFDKTKALCCNIFVILRRAFLFLSLFVFLHAQAADFSITNAGGGSYTETDSNGNIRLYGGVAGTCASPSATSTCNTCTSTTTPAVACNPTSVHSALEIGITIQTNAAVSNKTIAVYTGTDAEDALDHELSTGTITAAASTSVTAPVITWGELCDVDATIDNSNCIASGTSSVGTSFDNDRRIYVGIDSDGDGMEEAELDSIPVEFHYIDTSSAAINEQAVCASIDSAKYGSCGFSLDVGGDEKLFIRDIVGTSSVGSTPHTPTGAPDWYGVAFFYQDQTGQALNPANVSTASSEPIIKTYSTTDYSIDATLTGFQNYHDYCLIMGNINKAQNIFYLTTGGTSAENCGTPSEVVGLLDDKSCFISTAAFGSNMATEVETFRQFRNQFLIPHDFGRAFVKAYYKYSPPSANFIAQSKILRFAARVMLYPLYFFSLLSLKFGFLFALLSLVMTVLFLRQIKFFIQLWKSFSMGHRRYLKIFLLVFSVAFFSKPQAKAQLFPNETTVTHPGADADGLMKIDQNGVYIYKPLPQNVRQASHLRLGMVSNPDVESEICDENGGNCQNINFDDIYAGASGMGIEYLYEYFLFRDTNVNFGKLGLQVGASISYAQGNGRLVSDLNTESIETFSFLTVPLFAGALYRFEYRDRQILVPYAGGGGVYTLLVEKREDKSDVKAIGAPGFYGFGGGLLNLSALDRDMGSDFETEYDIKNLWLSAEFKFISVNSEAFSLENGYIQGGLGFDF